MRRLFHLLTLLAGGVLSAAELKVAAYHPLLEDLAKQVGGPRVEVVGMLATGGNPHAFEPGPEELRRATGARLHLVAGMGLETYLPSLESILPPGSLVVVGGTLPVLEGGCTDADHHHGHDDGHDHPSHEIDPHWWHSIDRFRRATTVVAEAFAAADPAGADQYRRRAGDYREKLDALERWVRLKVAHIPRDRRVLATTHAAFNYFCADFGFTPLPIQGLNHEQDPDPAKLARLAADLKSRRVAALFPEQGANPKLLEILTRDSGIPTGKPLAADGNSRTYEEMIRANVEAIVQALAAR